MLEVSGAGLKFDVLTCAKVQTHLKRVVLGSYRGVEFRLLLIRVTVNISLTKGRLRVELGVRW